MNIFFRVDSAPNIGTGHVMRCLNLADGLYHSSKPKPKISFICKNHSGNLIPLIKSRGYPVHSIPNHTEPQLDLNTWLGGPWQEDAHQTIQIINQNINSTVLIIDHYNIEENWEKEVIQNCPNIFTVVIEDFLTRPHYAHQLINQMFFQNTEKVKSIYRKIVQTPHTNPQTHFNTQLLVGTEYCLLNPKITQYRKEKQVTLPSSTFKVVICLGGADPENITNLVLQNLPLPLPLPLPHETPIPCAYTVIIGSSNRHKTILQETIKQSPFAKQIKLLQNLSQEEMFQIVSESDLAIGSIGVSIFERFCLGVPTIVITIADNQLEIANELSQAQLIDYIGFKTNFQKTEISRLIQFYMKNPRILKEKQIKCQRVCDGQGINRIVNILMDSLPPTPLESSHSHPIGCIIQARMTSTRLPGKVLLPVFNELCMLEIVLKRLQKSTTLDKIIVATTTNHTDDPIIDLCQKLDIPTFRGSEHNVLERYYQAAKTHQLQTVVRVTSDCPLIDWETVDDLIRFYLISRSPSPAQPSSPAQPPSHSPSHFPSYDYVSNVLERTYPRGLDTEVFSFSALEKTYQTAQHPAELEHVTTKIIRDNQDQFQKYVFTQSLPEFPHPENYRLTVDTQQDLNLIREIYRQTQNLYIKQVEVLQFLQDHSDLLELNKDIQQKEIDLTQSASGSGSNS